jgi:uncharacterized membrane protein YkoI
MKLFFSILILLSVTACSKECLHQSQIPPVVKENFSRLYPGVSVDKWEMNGENYEAEFSEGKKETKVLFDDSGNFVSSEKEIKNAGLPDAVIEYCDSKFAGYKMKDPAIITDSNGNISYEVELRNKNEEIEIRFDKFGMLINQSISQNNNQ